MDGSGHWPGRVEAGDLDRGADKNQDFRVHPKRAKEPADPPSWSGTGKPDPDGVNRTPGRTSRTLIQTPNGPRILRNAETTLATDPSFRDIALEVRNRMGTDHYTNYRANLNQAIKKILAGSADHPLKRILEVKGDTIYWKAGTSFAGQPLEYAHTVAQQSIKNIGADEALATAPQNLEPVGGVFHRTEYGHLWETLTNYLRNTPAAARATKAGTREWAISPVPPGRRGQAGFITIGGMMFLAVTAGTAIVIIRSSQSRSEAVAELATVGVGLALNQIIVKALGGGAGFAVGVVIGMYSDDPILNRQHAIEEAQREAVEKFIDKFIAKDLPEAATNIHHRFWFDERRYDPAVVEQVHQLLFDIPPTQPQPIQ